MEVYIGIYGGHQKSAAVAITQKKVLGIVTGKSLNLHTFNPDEVIERLGELLNKLSGRIGIERLELQGRTRKLVLALPGAAIDTDQLLAEYCLGINGWKDKTKFRVVDDTWAGLFGGTLSSRGICAFAGTGASVFVGLGEFKPSKTHKMDGWGPILGDFGSGFQLVVDMFRFLGRSIDRNYTPPLFTEIINAEPRISRIENVQSWFDRLYILRPNEWRIRFANLAAPITRAADRSDPDSDAVELVRSAAVSLVKTIEIALERFQLESETLPIVFQGGMFEYSKLYRNTVATELREKYNNEIRMALYRTVFGAALMACSHPYFSISQESLKLITENICELPADEQKLLTYSDVKIEAFEEEK